MDQSLRAPFLEAISHVFDTLFQMRVAADPARPISPFPSPRDVTGLIAMSGDLQGVVVLHMPMTTAQRVVGLFVGREVTPDDTEQIRDAVGELLEMIAGNAKARLDGRSISIGCHSVAVGRREPHEGRHERAVELLCECECGEFTVEIGVLDNADPADAPVEHASVRI